MDKNIYDMLNDNNIDLDELSKDNFTDIEKQKIKRNFKNMISKNISSKKKKSIIVAAIATIVIVGALGINSPTSVVAAIKTIATDIATFLGIDKDLSSYKTVVGKTLTSDGTSITLNEVILDGDDLIVSSTVKTDRKLPEPKSISADCRVYINGESPGRGMVGTGRMIDDFTFDHLATDSFIKRDFSGELDVKVVYTHIRLGTGDFIAIDPLIFEFTTSWDELAVDTLEVPLNYKFALGERVTLNSYTSNAISEKIYFTYDNDEKEGSYYTIELRGYDDLGNEVSFYMSSSNGNSGVFKRYDIEERNEEAKTLKLAPYAALLSDLEGQGEPFDREEYKNKFVKVGEEFTIQLE